MKSRNFVSLSIGLLTISDTRSIDEDKSGNLLYERIGKVAIRYCTEK